jgi:hypothetical protein
MRLSILAIEFGVWEVCRDHPEQHSLCEALWRWLGLADTRSSFTETMNMFHKPSQPPQPSSPSKLLRPAIEAANTIAVTT